MTAEESIKFEQLDVPRARALMATIHNMPCRIMNQFAQPVTYWLRPGDGSTAYLENAHVYTVAHALEAIQSQGGEFQQVLIIERGSAMAEADADGVVRLNYMQVKSHISEIGAKMCYYFFPGKGYAKDPFGTGYTPMTDLAAKISVNTWLKNLDLACFGVELCEMVDQKEAERIKALPAKRCELAKVLAPTLIESLKLAPENPVYRSMVMARLKVMPPHSVKTFEELQRWIEYENDPPITPLGGELDNSRYPGVTVAAARNLQRALPEGRVATEPGRNVFSIEVECEDEESGSVRYTVNRSGIFIGQVNSTRIMELVRQGYTFDRMVSRLSQDLTQMAVDNPPAMVHDEDSYEYNNYRVSDFNGFEAHVPETSLGSCLAMYLRSELGRDALERIGVPPN